ncbi:four helix bundle protein [Gramella jeungdoensis]|uniref:Four helix bundle protein n=1 Tax=Gramella jeungdoensis TaxID=708091 RepID=A0ABT0Z0D1_9FLAO|nr:four helix bundle protein [Gramella jeungdoensis]MCM8569186.1 four helix bundle protein [Gramella jeungdoensis]
MKSYKDLDTYNLAFQYALEVHKVSMKLPKFENREVRFGDLQKA